MAEDSVDMTWWVTTSQPRNEKECFSMMRKAIKGGAGQDGALKILLRYMDNRRVAHDLLAAGDGEE